MSELTAEEKQRKGLRGLFRFLKRRDSEAALREAIEEFIEESETTDADQPATGESSLLLNILKLGEKTAYDVMTPRVDIRAAPEDIDFRGLIQLVREHGHSRVPIYRNDLDEIVGIGHIKDVLPYIFEPETFQPDFLKSSMVACSRLPLGKPRVNSLTFYRPLWDRKFARRSLSNRHYRAGGKNSFGSLRGRRRPRPGGPEAKPCRCRSR